MNIFEWTPDIFLSCSYYYYGLSVTDYTRQTVNTTGCRSQVYRRPADLQMRLIGAAICIDISIAHITALLDNSSKSTPYDYGFEMIDIEASLNAFPLISLSAGEYLLTQEEKTDSIYFLLEGSVKVTKDGYEVAVISDKGAVFGEMSILLDNKHSASVQCLEDSKFYHIEHPGKYLENHPKVIWHIAQILGLRLFNLNQYLVDVKSQYEGHDHLHMVDDVLETLLNQQKTKVLQREDSKRDTPDY